MTLVHWWCHNDLQRVQAVSFAADGGHGVLWRCDVVMVNDLVTAFCRTRFRFVALCLSMGCAYIGIYSTVSKERERSQEDPSFLARTAQEKSEPQAKDLEIRGLCVS